MAKSYCQYLQLLESQQTPVRDVSSIKQSRYGPGHEKYPSWPIPEMSVSHVDPARDLPQSILTSSNARSRSFADETDYVKESSPNYIRPYMRRLECHLHEPQENNDYSYKSFPWTCECKCMNPHSLQGPQDASGHSSEHASCNNRPSSSYGIRKAISSPSSSNSDALEKSLCADDWEAYTKKYANSEGYHSYISTESILGPNAVSPFLDLIQRDSDSQSSRWSQEARPSEIFQPTATNITEADCRTPKSSANSNCDGSKCADVNSDFSEAKFSKSAVLLKKTPDVTKVRRQNSLHSSYSYSSLKNNAEYEAANNGNPKLTSRSISSAAMHLETDRQNSREWRTNDYLGTQQVERIAPLTVAERISALEKFPSTRTEPRVQAGSSQDAKFPTRRLHEVSAEQDVPRHSGYRINRMDSQDSDHSSEATASSTLKPSYSYLDPQKKLRVADLTLKAIQKQALLSYYERHAGKPANIVRPSTDERNDPLRPSTCSSNSFWNVNENLDSQELKLFTDNYLPNTSGELQKTEIPEMEHTATSITRVPCMRKFTEGTSSSDSFQSSVGIATAIVAPLHIRESKAKSTISNSRLSRPENKHSVVPEPLEGIRIDNIESFLKPPKRPPKKPRPFGEAVIQTIRSIATEANRSQPVPLPRGIAWQTIEGHNRGAIGDLSLTFANPVGFNRCNSPDLPLPPPPVSPGNDDCLRINDEPLPPPPTIEEPINNGRRCMGNQHRNVRRVSDQNVTTTSAVNVFPTTTISRTYSDVMEENAPTTGHDHSSEPRVTFVLPKELKFQSLTDLGSKSTGACITKESPASPNRHFDSILPPNSAYFTTSECKARLLTQYKDVNNGVVCISNGIELLKQKEELVSRISRKLEILRGEQLDIKEEINSNELLGRTVSSKVECKAKPNEFVKFRIHTDEIEKITSLLLGLSGRLARAENALMGSSDKLNPKEKIILEGKRDKLKNQLQEAKILKEGIDFRSAQVSGFLQKYLSSEEYEDYLHFMKMKAKLIVDAREIDDKIKLGEEQMAALQEALAL